MNRIDVSPIKALFLADQAERGNWQKNPSSQIWDQILEADRVRRREVKRLFDADEISTAEDFLFAGVMMLHGEEADEFIIGHAFAMSAAALGHKDAAWLSACTFDRLMQSLGRAQVFDAQPTTHADGVTPIVMAEKTVHLPSSMKALFKVAPGDEDEDE